MEVIPRVLLRGIPSKVESGKEQPFKKRREKKTCPILLKNNSFDAITHILWAADFLQNSLENSSEFLNFSAKFNSRAPTRDATKRAAAAALTNVILVETKFYENP